MVIKIDKNTERKKRHQRVRLKISGTGEMPRLNVYRSLSHIYAQIINDEEANTVVSCSSVDKDVVAKCNGLSKSEVAKLIGKLVGEKAIAKGISAVVFDRGGYLYTGRVAKLAEGAREAGLKF